MVEPKAKKISEWCRGVWNISEPTYITGFSIDTRTIQPGNMYFAINGDQFDGHDYVNQAFLNGASAAVVRSDWDSFSENEMCLLRVVDTRKALGDVAHGYRCEVNPDIIGITGSAGKTSVKEMTAHILSGHTLTAKSCGNWNNDIGLPLSLLEMDSKSRVGVFEIGTNHPGEITRLCGILEPRRGLVTNVGAAHIGNFGGIDEIVKEKATLLESLPSNGMAILDKDGMYYNRLREASPDHVVTISAKEPADYRIHRFNGKTGAKIDDEKTGSSYYFDLEIPSDFHAINLMFAVATARTYGMVWEEILASLRSCPALDLRWQIEVHNGVYIVNDAYNANPLSMHAALCAFSELTSSGRKWLVFGGMSELGDSTECEHITLGESIAHGNWAGLIVVGELGKKIIMGALRAGWATNATYCCENNVEARVILRDFVKPGDAVLLKGSRDYHLEELVEAFLR